MSRRLLAYDTTNFHTFIATTNTRNTVAQPGHNKQGNLIRAHRTTDSAF